MAALICDGIGKLCSSCGSICTLPCRVLSKVCGSACNAAGKLCSGPFCLYTITAVALNLPAIIIAGKSLSNGFNDCKGSMWLLINLVLCVINIGAACYISAKSQDLNDPELQAHATMFSRIIHVLCYDPVVAVYILILVFCFCWLGVGVKWKVSDKMYEGGECEDGISGAMSASIGCGYAFFSIGCMALCCSLCCAGCDGRRFNNNTDNPVNTNSTIQQENLTQQDNYVAPSTQPNADVENNIPVAIPVPAQMGKSGYAGQTTYGATVPATAEVQPIPSAPPLPSTATTKGAKVGEKLGKIFSADEKNQAKLQQHGATAGDAVSSSISAVKKFIGSKKGK